MKTQNSLNGLGPYGAIKQFVTDLDSAYIGTERGPNNCIDTSDNTLVSTENEKENTEKAVGKTYKWDIVWRNVLLMLTVHMAGFYGLYTKFYYVPKWQTIIWNLGAIVAGGFGVTAGRHRLWSHKCYKAHMYLEALLALLASTIYEQSIYVWCRDHRLHHKFSDTDADPYNSRRGFFFCHIGWFFLRKHEQVKEKGKTIDLSDLEANPIVMFEHDHNKLLAFIFTFLLPGFIPWFFWNEVPEISVFYCCFYRLIVVLHITWSVNSFAHLYGWRPYDQNIQPVENDMVALFTIGEGFHNYHHTFPWDYKTAELGSDTRNLTTIFIDTAAFLGFATDRKTVSKEMLQKRIERTGKAELITEKKNIRNLIILLTVAVIFL